MEFRLPRQLAEEGKEGPIIEFLSRRPTLTFVKGEIPLFRIEPEERFLAALGKEVMRRRVIYGLEAIDASLAEEERGLKDRGRRVSRLIVTSRDGSPRFYRSVARLIEKHTPRLLGLILEVEGQTLGTICGRKEGRPVKAILVKHKAGVAELLSALLN